MSVTIDVDALLTNMAQELKALITEQNITDPLLVGIHTGGEGDGYRGILIGDD